MRVTPSLLVAIAAVGAANAAAVGSYKSNANTVQLKRSSVLETAAANLAPVAAVRRAELAASFVSLEQRGGGTGASVENAPLDALLGIFGHLDNIIHIGADALIDLLGTAKYAIQTQLDILQVFLNGWFLVAVKAVKGVEGLLKAIISIHVEVSVALIRLIQKLPCLIDFVGAFIGQDIAALINGAKLGLGGLQATPAARSSSPTARSTALRTFRASSPLLAPRVCSRPLCKSLAPPRCSRASSTSLMFPPLFPVSAPLASTPSSRPSSRSTTWRPSMALPALSLLLSAFKPDRTHFRVELVQMVAVARWPCLPST